MSELEKVIGHIFRDPSLLQLALTHGSVGYESQRAQADNQRLEFLGDAVLQLALSDLLFQRLPQADEGVLTQSRAQLVSTKALARIARRIGLGAHLLLGRGEEANGGRDRESNLADALEAVAGAVHLDAGTAAAHAFAARLFAEELEALNRGPLDINPKGQLQELIQAVGTEPPHYEIVGSEGPDHAKNFVAAVSWRGCRLGEGSGRSKKDAEVQAAHAALQNPALGGLLRTTREQ
ncbi:ribonuclease III [Prosthecobacter vanneervenii]|uniref:Ribonuclease 3 n=1 Tax=Prosthecobacter vanneervenii TaxID=48466 RepID=A0A7W7YEB1_9BACT|nr:ribonuclease III [Prosthecobacter vanneervenii]MBB5034612.1 ribonuclease-3 [Prosthecobacter vanneervenii]